MSAVTAAEIAAVLAGKRRSAVVAGDCIDVLKAIPDASVDAVVCDPPAGISFMSKIWDKPGILGVSGGVASPTTTSNRNPSCRACGGRKRAGEATKACECDTPDWNDVEYRLADRRAFVAFIAAAMRECLRVLKPGGHALVWALPRTSHWTATGIEDAGFEVRDVVTHHFGQGYPKSLDVSKALDRAAGAEREVLGVEDRRSIYDERERSSVAVNSLYREMEGRDDARDVSTRTVTAPATPEAAQWSGWGTALKPASENWILARKPLEGTVASNVLARGVGGLNIDGCRIGFVGTADEAESKGKNRHADFGSSARDNRVYGADGKLRGADGNYNPPGRWPANLVLSHAEGCERVGTKRVRNPGGVPDATSSKDSLPSFTSADRTSTIHHFGADGMEMVEAWRCVDGCPVAELDAQSGTSSSPGTYKRATEVENRVYGASSPRPIQHGHGDVGGASRFFYQAKADASDKYVYCRVCKDAYPIAAEAKHGHGGGRDHLVRHPTVKSTDLMRWMTRLITPPGGVVLDCFAGTGSTGVAAMQEGMRFIGIERDPEYARIAQRRLEDDSPLLAFAERKASEGSS